MVLGTGDTKDTIISDAPLPLFFNTVSLPVRKMCTLQVRHRSIFTSSDASRIQRSEEAQIHRPVWRLVSRGNLRERASGTQTSYSARRFRRRSWAFLLRFGDRSWEVRDVIPRRDPRHIPHQTGLGGMGFGRSRTSSLPGCPAAHHVAVIGRAGTDDERLSPDDTLRVHLERERGEPVQGDAACAEVHVVHVHLG